MIHNVFGIIYIFLGTCWNIKSAGTGALNALFQQTFQIKITSPLLRRKIMEQIPCGMNQQTCYNANKISGAPKFSEELSLTLFNFCSRNG